jgi:zinc protease
VAESTRIVVPTVERAVVGGVPVFVVDGPAPARCAVMFRVGRSDETLPRAGITHLVEHLALFGIGEVQYSCNGFVDGLRTVFHAEGSEEECIDFLGAVTRSLGDLPEARVVREREILAAEAAGRGSGIVDELLCYRFGPRGLGLIGYPEHGLRWLDPPTVDWWRRQAFHAGNAAVWVCGVDPDRLTLALEPGPRRAVPPVDPVETELPAWFTPRSAGVSLSMVASRTVALSAGLRIAQKRLHKRLRTDMALVYHVEVGAQLLGPDQVHVAVVCDPLHDNAPAARLALETELRTLAESGPTESELELDRRAGERAATRPEAVALAYADAMAHDELLGAPARTPAERVDEADAVTARDVARAMGGALDTALWAVPQGADPRNTRVVAGWSPTVVNGTPLPSAAGATHPTDTLVLSGEGITRTTPHGAVTVRFDECAATLFWGDGTRTLFGSDGFILQVKPWEWKGGEQAVRLIDERTDVYRRVPMGPGDGPPAPVAPAAQAKQPNPHVRKAVFITIGAVCSLLAAVVLFSAPLVETSDVRVPDSAIIPVKSDGTVDCGGTMTLTVALNMGHSPAAGATGDAVDKACRESAQGEAVGMTLLGAGPWAFLAIRRLIRFRKAPKTARRTA